jgi:hypothetical protein
MRVWLKLPECVSVRQSQAKAFCWALHVTLTPPDPRGPGHWTELWQRPEKLKCSQCLSQRMGQLYTHREEAAIMRLHVQQVHPRKLLHHTPGRKAPCHTQGKSFITLEEGKCSVTLEGRPLSHSRKEGTLSHLRKAGPITLQKGALSLFPSTLVLSDNLNKTNITRSWGPDSHVSKFLHVWQCSRFLGNLSCRLA